MKERLVEISARRDMFGVQKRALVEECGKLRGEIREREQRVHQLIKRYTFTRSIHSPVQSFSFELNVRQLLGCSNFT